VTSKKDTLYTQATATPGSFRFDERVVDVFPDMINRSVPGYALIVPMIGQLARRFVQPDSTVHDLGCSLGAATLAMQDALAGRDQLDGVRLIATDNAPAMVDRFRDLLQERPVPPGAPPIELRCEDIRATKIENASLIVLNFTLQFLGLEERDHLLETISAGLKPGGALILAEKIRFPDSGEQDRQTDWHHDYKRLQGYSELEIARKRAALEEVLKTELESTHRERLTRVGFVRVTRWFQCFGFCAWLAER